MATRLPSPAPSPPPATPSLSLPVEINAATRKQHTLLNRLIAERVPLSLPPHATDPDLLGLGLAAFARIYFTFEAEWRQLTTLEESDVPNHGHESQVLCFLSQLRPPGLDRTARLKDDLELLSLRTDVNTASALGIEQQQMMDNMVHSIRSKPHVLIAFAWIMYMATFSGGRWIRQQFANAGLEFWTGQQGCTVMSLEKQGHRNPNIPSFSFLSFEGEHDGEDIKAEFKARLTGADALLTDKDRHDIVQAARELFDCCITLVGLLDRAVWWHNIKHRLLTLLLWFCMFGAVFGFEYGLRYGQAHMYDAWHWYTSTQRF